MTEQGRVGKWFMTAERDLPFVQRLLLDGMRPR
jgi:hypothetical protein